MRMRVFLVFAWFVIFPFGQLGRSEFGGITVHLLDIVTGIVAVLFLAEKIVNRSWPRFPFDLPIGRFVAVLLFSFFLSISMGFYNLNQVLVAGLYLLRLCVYLLFYFVLCEMVDTKVLTKKLLTNSLLIIGAFSVLFGFIQYFGFPETKILAEFGWDPHQGRLLGTFLDPGFSGLIFAFFTLLIISRKQGRGGQEFLFWFLSLFGFSALLLTYSRASYLAFAAGLIVIYIVRRNLKVLLWLALLLLFILPKPVSDTGNESTRLIRTSTINLRMQNYQETLEVAGNNPLFGVGFNFLGVWVGSGKHSGMGSDSSFLSILATSGVVGGIVFASLIGNVFAYYWKRKTQNYTAATLAVLAALAVHSFFNNSLFYPWVLGWVLVLVVATSSMEDFTVQK